LNITTQKRIPCGEKRADEKGVAADISHDLSRGRTKLKKGAGRLKRKKRKQS